MFVCLVVIEKNLSNCLNDKFNIYREAFYNPGKLITILGKSTSTLPRELAPRKSKLLKKLFLLKLQCKEEGRHPLPPFSEVILEAWRDGDSGV